MAEYLPPINIAKVFNISDYDFQDTSLTLKDGDQRYLNPIKKLQNETFGITYNGTTETTNVSKNINISHLMNTVNGAIRNDVAIGESLAVGSNLVVGKNIVNSGDIHTNDIYAKSINLNSVVIANVPILPQKISFTSTLTSDAQSQVDSISTRISDSAPKSYIDSQDTILGTRINESYSSAISYVDSQTTVLDTKITETESAQKIYIDVADMALGTRIMETESAQKTYIDEADTALGTRITETESAQKTYIDEADTALGTRITETDSAQRTYIDTQILSLGAYYINNGVGTYPIYGSISDFSSLNMELYIQTDRDSFIILPNYALYLFSEINQTGSYLPIGNRTTNIQYYNISKTARVKSCTLYKWNGTAYIQVSTVNSTNAEQTWI